MNTRSLAVRAIVFAFLAPGSVTVLGPWLVLRAEQGSSLPVGAGRWVGIPLLVLGAATLAWCFADFVRKGRGTPAPWDAPERLVSGGLYRFVRNPMYVGVLTVLVGEALLFRSAWLLGYAAGVWIVFHLMVTLYEEPTLRGQFGERYEAYRTNVPRWIPTPRGSRRWSAP